MSGNNIFNENKPVVDANGKKPVHTASLVLGILSLVFSLLLALAGEVLGIIGIVLACKHRKEMNTKAALVCSIIGLIVSFVNHILGILLLMV